MVHGVTLGVSGQAKVLEINLYNVHPWTFKAGVSEQLKEEKNEHEQYYLKSTNTI